MRSFLQSRPVKIIGIVAIVVLLSAVLAAAIWLANPSEAMPEAANSLTSDSIVKVQQGDWIAFEPRSGRATAGLILYPGGRVVAEAYGPTGRALAKEGYLIVIVPMPLNLAVLAPDSALTVIEEYDFIDHWAVGGHSLGGAMAARFVHNHPGLVQGLVLWASFPAQSDDLSGRDLAVTSIYASNDGLATSQDVLASADRLPPTATFVAIDGGNHAQFGWYGPQSGDGQPNISRPVQQQRIIEATHDLLRRITPSASSQTAAKSCELDRLVEAIELTSAHEGTNVR